MVEPVLRLSDRYELQAVIARGGAGRVHRARDLRLDRSVAVKVLTDLGDEGVARFRREAAIAARIRHPNVVTLHDAGVDGAPYLVMSLVEGPSLAERVSGDGPLAEGLVQRLARDLFAGLAATHAAGVLHRDLTPRNVLFDETGRALLADFGVARGQDDPTVTGEHTVMGTRPFVAPERLRGMPATVASDLFAAGMTLRYAITGSHSMPVPPGHAVARLVATCTADHPSMRPETAGDAARWLDDRPSRDADLPRTQALPLDDTVAIRRSSADPAAEPPTMPPRGTVAIPPEGTAAMPTDTIVIDEPAGSARIPRTVRYVAVAAVLLVAATLGSAAVRSGTPGERPDVAETTGGSEAPVFDPDHPGASARELAQWLRERAGG